MDDTHDKPPSAGASGVHPSLAGGVEEDTPVPSTTTDLPLTPPPSSLPPISPPEHLASPLSTPPSSALSEVAPAAPVLAGDTNAAVDALGDDESKKTSSGRIGDEMVARGHITEGQLNVALQEKKVSGKLLGEIMVDLGFITQDFLTAFLSESSGFAVFDPSEAIIDSEVLQLIEKEIAIKYQLLLISVSDDEALVVMADPYDVMATDTLRHYLPVGTRVRLMVANPIALSDAIDAAYGYASDINDILKELEEGGGDADLTALSEEEAYAHPIVRLVNALVFDAVKLGASDLHFEPEENFSRLRYRKDGVLFTAQILHKQHWSAIAQRLKIMSGMNITDKLSPQDGRFYMNVGGHEADFRVSSLPTVHGENIVLRVLDKNSSIIPMEELGFSAFNLENIRKSQSRPEGIIIVTGPTGSGKTTSLYSMLNEISTVDVNIQTLEDPVEYSLPMIRQTHVREGVLDFSDGIKALLRQDPDIIFIGEIRDQETAGMALKAAMTGHQVYTTLHTNDSFSAIPRLMDLGMKPGMVAGSIVSVFAQRLVRKVCKTCRESYQPDEADCKLLGISRDEASVIYRAKQGGCPDCEGQGYKGRTAIVEILLFNDDLDQIVARSGTRVELMQKAVENGFKSMRDDGLLRILEGVTTIDELARVVSLNR